MSDHKNEDSLEKRVLNWLSQEGYPLEFFTANCFHKSGFRVFQGYYTEDSTADIIREIDILAYVDRNVEDGLVRIEHVIECKYAKDKPWVVFTSRHSHIASAACVAQTIGSGLGHTLLWLVAGNKDLHKTTVFSTPTSPGFGGRQAFTKDNDVFFAAIQSVASKALSVANKYDKPFTEKGKMPLYASIVLPIIVIDGELFEACYSETTESITILPAAMLRLHWRGSAAWRLHTTVDIVTKGHLEEYVSRRKSEMKMILSALESGYHTISECFKKGNLEPFEASIGCAGRGIVGIPPLLVPLAKQKKQKHTE